MFKKLKRWQRWLLEISIAVAIFVAIDQWRASDLLATDDPAPQARLVTLTGSVEDIVPEGQRTLVYFFAPWCSICKLSIGNLNSIKADYPDLAVRLVALDYQSPREVIEFIDNQELSFPVLMANRQIGQQWQIKAYPTYYLVAKDGTIEARNMGYSSEAGMRVRL